MHLRGKAMMVEAILPDGTSEVVSYVKDFNFNWMTNYIYTDEASPVFPKGTIIHVSAYYDNTKANKSNPDPDQWVGWGDRTVDEMGRQLLPVSPQNYEVWLTYMTHSSPDLRQAVDDGRFREDLLFRLRYMQLHIPPLRSRGGDWELMLEHYVRRLKDTYCGRLARAFTTEDFELL